MERRTAIVATWFFIRTGDLDDTFAIAEIIAHDPDELVQKAVGGWVREAGKRDEARLRAYLDDEMIPTLAKLGFTTRIIENPIDGYGPFVIAHSPDHRVAGYLDNQLPGQVASDPEDIAAMMAAWENVRGEALSHWQSVDLIREVAESWS